MKKVLTLLALFMACGISTLAQDRPIFEVNGGYTFQRWDLPSFIQPPDHLNMNGFNVGAAFHVTKWLAAAADITGTYNSQTDPVVPGSDKTSIYSYLFGPRIYPLGHHKLTPYAHALFGAATYKLTVPGVPEINETNFSFEIGGGIDWKVTRHVSIRLGQFDYQQTRALHPEAVATGVPTENQNNFKYSAGIVFKFGER